MVAISKQLAVGLIGTGFGLDVHAPGFMAAGDFEILAVCSAQKARAEGAAHDLGATVAVDDYRQLLEMPEVDLVDICTPPRSHMEMAVAALHAGKHVLCEKPFAMHAAEAGQMLDIASVSSQVSAINHEMRYFPVRRHLKDLVGSGYVGQLRLVNATVIAGHATNPTVEPHWYTWASLRREAGGVLNSLLSHHLDLLRFTFGELTDVRGVARTSITEKPVLAWDYRHGDPIGPDSPTSAREPVDADDVVVGHGTVGANALFTLAGTWSAYHGSGVRVEVYGDQGTLVLQPNGLLLGAPSDGAALSPITTPTSYDLPSTGDHWAVAPFAALAADLASSIRDDGLGPSLFATFADGFRLQEITDAVLGDFAS